MSQLKKMRKGSEIIAEMFHGYGVTHVFYVESILRHTMVLMNDLDIKHIQTHSEKAAAYMADGFARASRRFGVCMAQSTGAANLASGLQDAYLSHSPVLAITGRQPSHNSHRNAYQELDHWPLFEPVTKYNVGFHTTAELPRILRQAIRETVSGAPRPVHIEFPQHQGMIIENGEIACDIVIEERFKQAPAYRPLPDPADVAAVVKRLYAAERPLLVIGVGAIYSDAGSELLRLIETLGIPFATTVDGKSIIPEIHPLCCGPIGGYGRQCANAIAAEADLMIFIGSSISDQATNGWILPPEGTPIVQIDINPLEMGRNYPLAASILADAKMAITAMNAGLSGPHKNQAWGKRAEAMVAAWRQSLEAARNASDVPIRTDRLCKELQDILPDNAILAADTGFSAIWPAAMIEITKPGQRFIRPGGGSLGWAFPAALGMKCGVPDRPVVCFTGDGALWYHLAELETAVRCGINTVTVLNNNGGLGQCRRGIHQVYGERQPGRPQEQYLFTDVNFTNIAREIGAFAVRVEQPEDIRPAVEQALACGRPALVEVVTDIACDPQDADAIPSITVK